jgi:hypothetical protein
MKTREWRIEDGGWRTRGVLECGSPLPLLRCDIDPALQSARGLAQSKTCRMFGALLTFLALTISARAQSYSIDWYKISGGGGTSTNGQFAVTGTIGQPDAGGPLTGGGYSLTGGFWAVYLVQTPGAPALTITRSGSSVIVSWPSPSTGWTLQQNANLASANGWTTSSGIADDGTTKSLTLTAPAGNLFFRLTNP